MNDVQDVFVAEGLHRNEEKNLEEFEAIRAAKAITVEEVMAMIKNGSLIDGQSLAALMQFIAWRGY